MIEKDIKQIFEFVKQDDLISFCKSINQNPNILNISFGRFPLLSVCLLYNSKKIAKKFFKQLYLKNSYQKVEEPFCLYTDFRQKADKAIRLYANKENFVLPIEMLAVLGKDKLVKKYYKKENQNNELSQKLEKIYALKGQKFETTNGKVYISHKKLSYTQKKILLWANCLAVVIVAVVGLLTMFVSNVYGLGTFQSPKKVFTIANLKSLSNKHSVAELQNDLVIDDVCSLENFYGTILGNNYTITITKYENYLIKNLQGKIQDVKIIFKPAEYQIDKSFSFLTLENNGTIENVDIEASGNFDINSTNQDTFVCGFAVKNNNYIHNCSFLGEINLSSQNTLNSYFAGFAGENYGTIASCETKENSIFSSNNVDVCGIANINYGSANISSSNNFASIEQTSQLESWSPNVAGISNSNLGKIENCINSGNLKATSSTETTFDGAVLIGGISSTNSGEIYHSKNTGNLTATSENINIFAGGIAGYVNQSSPTDNPTINECASTNTLNLSKTASTKFVYGGGIAGYMIGNINNSYAICEFENGYDKDTNYMIGLMIGSTSLQYNYFTQQYTLMLNIENIYCLKTENANFPVAIGYSNFGYIYVENIDGVETLYLCEDTNDITTSSIYW